MSREALPPSVPLLGHPFEGPQLDPGAANGIFPLGGNRADDDAQSSRAITKQANKSIPLSSTQTIEAEKAKQTRRLIRQLQMLFPG